MNKVRDPLGYSLHDVLGLIAQLHEVPIAQASGVTVGSLTSEAFGQIRAASAGRSPSH